MKRTLLTLSAAILLAAAFTVVGKTFSQDAPTPVISETGVGDRWEYLVVAGSSNASLTPSGNPEMRKEPRGPFGREAFVLEQNLDKLGAKGWELVSVSGSTADPVYYFKRRK